MAKTTRRKRRRKQRKTRSNRRSRKMRGGRIAELKGVPPGGACGGCHRLWGRMQRLIEVVNRCHPEGCPPTAVAPPEPPTPPPGAGGGAGYPPPVHPNTRVLPRAAPVPHGLGGGGGGGAAGGGRVVVRGDRNFGIGQNISTSGGGGVSVRVDADGRTVEYHAGQ